MFFLTAEAGSPVNLRITGTHEILSVEQAKYLFQLKEQGCTSECIQCHFRQRYLREVDSDDIEAFLADSLQAIEGSWAVQGEIVPAWDDSFPVVVPSGIYWDVLKLHKEEVSTVRVAIKLAHDWDLSDRERVAIEGHYEDTLPMNTEGVPIYPPTIEPEEHPGRTIENLPTTPLTPRLGRPRSSFSIPPPAYEGRPTFNGVQFRHPHEVVATGGHVAPFMHDPPEPPSYIDAGPHAIPPSYQSISLVDNSVSDRLLRTASATPLPPVPPRSLLRHSTVPGPTPPSPQRSASDEMPQERLLPGTDIIQYLHRPVAVPLQQLVAEEVSNITSINTTLAEMQEVFENPRPAPSIPQQNLATQDEEMPDVFANSYRRLNEPGPTLNPLISPLSSAFNMSRRLDSTTAVSDAGGSSLQLEYWDGISYEKDLASQLYLLGRGILQSVVPRARGVPQPPAHYLDDDGCVFQLESFLPLDLSQLTGACFAGIDGVVFVELSSGRLQPFFTPSSIARCFLQTLPYQTHNLHLVDLMHIDACTGTARVLLNIPPSIHSMEAFDFQANLAAPVMPAYLADYCREPPNLFEQIASRSLQSIEADCKSLHQELILLRHRSGEQLVGDVINQMLYLDDVAARFSSLCPTDMQWNLKLLGYALVIIRVKRWMHRHAQESEASLAIALEHLRSNGNCRRMLGETETLGRCPERPRNLSEFAMSSGCVLDWTFHLPDDLITPSIMPVRRQSLASIVLATQIAGGDGRQDPLELENALCLAVIGEILVADGFFHQAVFDHSLDTTYSLSWLAIMVHEAQTSRAVASLMQPTQSTSLSGLLSSDQESAILGDDYLDADFDPDIEKYCYPLPAPSREDLMDVGSRWWLARLAGKDGKVSMGLESHLSHGTKFTISMMKGIMTMLDVAVEESNRMRTDARVRDLLWEVHDSTQTLLTRYHIDPHSRYDGSMADERLEDEGESGRSSLALGSPPSSPTDIHMYAHDEDHPISRPAAGRNGLPQPPSRTPPSQDESVIRPSTPPLQSLRTPVSPLPLRQSLEHQRTSQSPLRTASLPTPSRPLIAGRGRPDLSPLTLSRDSFTRSAAPSPSPTLAHFPPFRTTVDISHDRPPFPSPMTPICPIPRLPLTATLSMVLHHAQDIFILSKWLLSRLRDDVYVDEVTERMADGVWEACRGVREVLGLSVG